MNDLEFAENILKNNNRPYYSIHFCHQAIEKLLKAIVQEHTPESPKRTHNFKMLWEQAHIPLSDDQKLQLLALMPHYLGTKYPEDVRDLHRTYTPEFVKKTLNTTKELFQCLKNYLTLKKL